METQKVTPIDPSLQLVSCHDRHLLEKYFTRVPELYLYELGDLDDFYFDKTIWYALQTRHGAPLEAAIMLYIGVTDPPVLWAMDEDRNSELKRHLIQKSMVLWPNEIYAHLPSNLFDFVSVHFETVQANGLHHRMLLTDLDAVLKVETQSVEQLIGLDSLPELTRFYAENYPGNFFDPRMLETGQYFVVRDPTVGIIAVAGVHSFSVQYKAAALGNITVHRDFRRRGFGKLVTARLCQSLIASRIHFIGLNVKASNEVAISCYKNLGFEIRASFYEAVMRRRH